MNYVDNDELYRVLCEWHEQKEIALAEGKDPPRLPEYVGEVILKQVEGMAMRYNFRNYTWIEEMKGEGIIKAVAAMNKFDPTRVGRSGKVNPFGFINFVIWRAFGGVISSEKKRNEELKNMMTDPGYQSYEADEYSDHDIDNSGLSDFFYRGA